MAIYDLGTASLAANGEVTGVGTTWKAPLTLIRVGATIVFKTEPVQIYTISEIISDTQINVYNPNSETVPAGTGYAILAHDGITVQGLAQDVAETLRYYQSSETEVADAVDAFNNFDQDKFSSDVNQVNTQYGEIITIGAQVSSDANQVALDKAESSASASSAEASAQLALNAANSVSGALTISFSDGGTIESPLQAVVYFGAEAGAEVYYWAGPLPKTVPQASSPGTTGGVSGSAWVKSNGLSVMSVEQLKYVQPSYPGQVVNVRGYYSGSISGGGIFYWDPDYAEADDYGHHIKSIVSPDGAWTRYTNNSFFSLSEFGCTGGSSDVTLNVLNAVKQASIYGKSCLFDVNFVASDLYFNGLSNVNIIGNGTIGKLADSVNGVLITFVACNGLKISGIKLDGNKENQTSTTQSEYPNGIGTLRIEQCSNWVVRDCEIFNNRLGAAVLIVDSGTNSSTNWRSSIQNGKLDSNYIHDNGVPGQSQSDGVFCWSHSTAITNNVIRRCNDYGIALDYSQRIFVSGNIISDVYVGMGILGVIDSVIDSNNLDTAELGLAVTLSGQVATEPFISKNVSITNNKIRNITSSTGLLADGITIDPSAQFIHVEGNTVINAKRGIVAPCEFANVLDNAVIDCRELSVYIKNKRGRFSGNETFNIDGTTAASSFISGRSSKEFLQSGIQKVSVVREVGTVSDVKLCSLKSDAQYAAAFVRVKFAGLVNSAGAYCASREWLITKNTTSDVVIASNDSANLGALNVIIISVDARDGEVGVYARFSSGSPTNSVFVIECESPAVTDSCYYIETQ